MNDMMAGAELSENRPSVVDAMQACEKNSSAKEDSSHNMRLLPEGYQPGEHDVLCGRGRKCFNHAGNVKFRAIVQSFLPQYSKSVAKLEKSYILSDVVEQVRKNSGEGGFIKKDPDSGRWYEVGDFLAREKTSQAFRDVLHDKYKSSNTAKKKRRQEEQAEKLFRAHSNRSLGASSLDASSVHSVGSSTTGDYMLADTKLRRMERSDSILNLGDADGEGQAQRHDDLLGGLDQDIANYGRPRMFNRQRSLRSVLDFDTNRRAVLSSAKSGSTSFYNRSSCPNLFAPPQRSHSGPQPPISQIEIIQEEDHSSHQQRHGEFAEFNNNNDLDSYSEAGVNDSSSSNHRVAAQNWFHHSQPNLFGDAPPVNPHAGSRRQFARQPMRRSNRSGSTSSAGSGVLAGVQQQIGNLGLNDNSNHGQPYNADQQVSSGVHIQGGSSVGGNAQNDRSFLPHGLQGMQMQQQQGMQMQQQQGMQMQQQQGMQMQQQQGMQMQQQPQGMQQQPQGMQQQQQPQHQPPPQTLSLGPMDNLGIESGTNNMDSSNNGNGMAMDEEDTDLLARLSALENVSFGMDVIDENPFEPVPLREG